MLGELLSSVVNAIAGFFSWLWGLLYPTLYNTFTVVWNAVVNTFWSWYSRVIYWVVYAIASLFPDNSLDFNSNVQALVQYVAGWDKLLPIHESFALLNVLVLYSLAKLSFRYAVFLISMLRKLIPT